MISIDRRDSRLWVRGLECLVLLEMFRQTARDHYNSGDPPVAAEDYLTPEWVARRVWEWCKQKFPAV